MGTLLFVLAFVVLGLAVVAAAFSGGSRGAAERHGKAPSLAARRAFGIVVGVLVLGLGVAVPTLVGVANGTSAAKDAPGGVELDDAQRHGRQVFAYNCAMCHTLKAANAVGKVGPNLDAMRPPENLTLDAIAKGRARGQGQMPAELVDDADARAVASFIAAVAGR